MSTKSINWLKELLLPMGVVAMETCWLYPWSLFLGVGSQPSGGRPPLSSVSIFGLVLFSLVVTRLVLRQKWSLARARLALVSLGLVAVLLTLHVDRYVQTGLVDPVWPIALARELPDAFSHPSTEVLAAGLGIFLWWRGIALGRGRLDFDRIEGAFRLGIIAMVGFLLLAAVNESAHGEGLQRGTTIYVVGFFFAGLTSLSLARVESIGKQSRAIGEYTLPFNRHWLAIVLGVVATLLLLTMGIAQLLSFDVITAIATPILNLLSTIAWLLLYTIAIAFGLLLEVLIYLARLLLHPATPPPPPLQPPEVSFLDRLREEDTARVLPPELALALKWLAIAVVILVAIVLLVRAVLRRIEWERDDVLEERDSVSPAGSLKLAVLAWLHSLYSRWFCRGATTTAMSDEVAEEVAKTSLAQTIRQIYRQLLMLAASVGPPRARSTTPYEHLPQLQALLKPEDALAAITEAYVKVRYGPDGPTDDEIQSVRARWQRVLASARPASTGVTEPEQEPDKSGSHKRKPSGDLPMSR
ncbi:MAG: DUF4129 domain-containing protein [Chloroflexi bacterium]|nr:DUF4129 domain-containing protein [Chloroflexota bacterium]